eukprot:scpid83597/ scgid30477/ 
MPFGKTCSQKASPITMVTVSSYPRQNAAVYPTQRSAYPTQQAAPVTAASSKPFVEPPMVAPVAPCPGQCQLPIPAQPYPPAYAPRESDAPPAYPGLHSASTGPAYPVVARPVASANTVASVHVLVKGQPTVVFEADARFGGPGRGGTFTVPPPPPGYQATYAQLAAASGLAVKVERKKTTFVYGGGDAGMSW